MTPDALEARLAGRPDTATVAAVIAKLRADPDWSVTEMTVEGQARVVELLHHPTGTFYTLSPRAGSRPHRG